MAVVTGTAPGATGAITYEDLYARWERGNWRATEIDLTQDRIDWHERLTADQRRGALWLYALFLHGEDSVTDDLSPYIDAAPLKEQKYFLATQQADEARHSIFFKRFMHEVVGRGEGSVASVLEATRSELTWGHRKVFGRLDAMAKELRADPSRRTLAAAVTLYHVVVEASLAPPGQHMLEHSPARPAPDRGLARAPRRPARLPRGDAPYLARRAAPHRLRRQAARRPLRRGAGRGDRGDRRPHPRGAALDRGRRAAAGLGPQLHRVLRLHLRGPRRGRRRVARAPPAGDRAAGQRPPALPDADGRPAARARAARAEAAAREPDRAGRRAGRPGSRGRRDHVRHDRPPGGRGRRPVRDDGRVGLHGRRAVAPRARRRGRLAGGRRAALESRPHPALPLRRLGRRRRRPRRSAGADAPRAAAPARQHPRAPRAPARVRLSDAAGRATGVPRSRENAAGHR